MDYLGIETSLYDTGITQYPTLTRVKELLNRNKEKITQYYKDYSRTINNDHFFITLLNQCFSYFGDTVEDTYYNLKFNYREFSQQFDLVSTSTHQKPKSVFYGKDYLVGVDSFYRLNDEIITPSFLGGRLNYMHSYKPVLMVYHEHYTLQPDLIDANGNESYSISLINIPLFGAMYHQWYSDNSKKEISSPISHFLTEYIYSTILDDVIDISFFNRLKQCINLGGTIYLDNSIINTDNHRILNSYLLNINDLVNEVVVEIATTLSKDTYSIGELLHRIPGLVKEDMRGLYPLYDNNGLNPMEWPNAFVQGWLMTQTSMVVNQLDRTITSSSTKMYSKKLNKSKRKVLKSVLPKEDQIWFENITAL